MNRISSIRPIPMLYGEQQSEAHKAEFERRRARQLCQDKPISLGTHYSADEFAESTRPFEYADENDELPKLVEEHRKDYSVAVKLVWFLAICIALWLAAHKFGWMNRA